MSQFNLLNFQTGVDTFNTGWIPPAERTPQVAAECDLIQATTPTFSDMFSHMSFAGALPDKVILNVLQAEAIKMFEKFIPSQFLFDTTLDGKPVKLFKNVQQNSGSCVGTRHTRYAWDHTLYEAFFENAQEKIVFPYTMYHYANGRKASGINSKGDGSTGHGQAKAITADGIIMFNFPGLPAVNINQDIEWTGSEEIQYSIPSMFPASAFAEGRAHKFGQAVLVDSLEAAKAVLASGRSIAFCSDWGATNGNLEAPMKEGLRWFERRGATWNHCWGIDGYWVHPVLGLIWHLTNNWGRCHGVCPSTGESFGFWTPTATVEYILRDRETYVFLDLAGFPEELRKRSQFFDLVF